MSKDQVIISWRDIYDCKIPGENRSDTATKAEVAGYRMFCHNGIIYVRTTGEYVKIGKVESAT